MHGYQNDSWCLSKIFKCSQSLLLIATLLSAAQSAQATLIFSPTSDTENVVSWNVAATNAPSVFTLRGIGDLFSGMHASILATAWTSSPFDNKASGRGNVHVDPHTLAYAWNVFDSNLSTAFATENVMMLQWAKSKPISR